MTHLQLLDALHLWLHREGGDRDLDRAVEAFDWSTFGVIALSPEQHRAMVALDSYRRGHRVDLIGEAEDFHELMSDAYCTAVDELVLKVDGAIACGHADNYVDNVIPLRRSPL